MIKLNLNLMYLTKKFGLSAKSLVMQSQGNSISKIMEKEGDKGNVKAADFEKEVLNDRNELIEAFKLADPINRYLILMSIDKSELKDFLMLMKPQDLAMGLKFFTKEKIVTLMRQLPQENLFAMLKELFSTEKIMRLIPDEELNKFLSSDKLNTSVIKKNINRLPPKALAQILEAVNGKPCKGQDTKGMIKSIDNLQKNELMEGITAMDSEYKAILSACLIEEDKSLIKNFSSKALTEPFKQLEKFDIIKSLGEGVEAKNLVPMVQELPKELLSMVATQLDVNKFADILIEQYQEILSQVALS